MSVERAIRERQAFEARIKEFLALAAALTTDEVEIALGGLADILGELSEVKDQERVMVKGHILRIYFDLRRTGRRAQGARPGYQSRETHPLMVAWREQIASAQKEWDLERQKMSFIQRFFADLSVPPDLRPKYPIISDSEMLIHQVASFVLLPDNTDVPGDVTPEAVMLLAP